MPCIVCNHTVQSVGRNEEGFRQFWCPRCGAIKTECGDHESWETPRWIRLLLDAQWDRVKVELLDSNQLRQELDALDEKLQAWRK